MLGGGDLMGGVQKDITVRGLGLASRQRGRHTLIRRRIRQRIRRRVANCKTKNLKPSSRFPTVLVQKVRTSLC